MKDKKSLALAYLTQSIKYLDLAEKIFEQMVNKGNPHVVTSIGGKHEPESIWKDYCEQTKWSDFNIIFPALFIFYHGIELMIKGLFPLMGSEIPFGHIDHKSDLLDKLKNELRDRKRTEFLSKQNIQIYPKQPKKRQNISDC